MIARAKETAPRCAWYIRMSSDAQEDSPHQQRPALTKLQNQHGGEFVREYFDSGISGTETTKRKEFQRMIEDAERGLFDTILAWDMDRIGRFDPMEANYYWFILRRAGVKIITVAQGELKFEELGDWLTNSVKQHGKHQYVLDLSRNSLRGKLDTLKAGWWIGPPPYGFDRVFFDRAGNQVHRTLFTERFQKPRDWRAKLAPANDQNATDLILRLFTELANGGNANSIAWDWNSRGIPSPYDKGWSRNVLTCMLRNPVYAGHTAIGKTTEAKHHCIIDGEITKKTKPGRTERQSDCLILRNTHPGIVPQVLFDKVQALLGDRRDRQERPKSTGYSLTGLLRCGHCGARMHGHYRAGFRIYCCSGTKKGPAYCRSRVVRASEIENCLVAWLLEIIPNGDGLTRLKDSLNAKRKARKVSARTGDEQRLATTVADLDKKIRRGSENLLLADPDSMPSLQAVLLDWQQQRTDAQGRLDALQKRSGKAHPTPDRDVIEQALAELQRLTDTIHNAPVEQQRAVFKSTIKQVVLWWDMLPTKMKKPKFRRYRLSRGLIVTSEDSALSTVMSAVPGHPSHNRSQFAFDIGEGFAGTAPDRAVAALKGLYQGKGVGSRLIAQRLGVTQGNATRSMRKCVEMGLARKGQHGFGWMPIVKGEG